MPQLVELEGRRFIPFIEVRVETKTASAEETELNPFMEVYGASPDRFKLSKTPFLEQREYPTDYEYLIFRSLTLLNEEGDVKSIDWDIVCLRGPFFLRNLTPDNQ